MTATGKITWMRLPKLLGDQSIKPCAKNGKHGTAVFNVFFPQFLYCLGSSVSFSMPIFLLYGVTMFNLCHWVTYIEVYELPLQMYKT